MAQIAWLLAAITLSASGAVAGEIYRWTDADGSVHFGEDLSRVPPEQRAAARRDADAPGNGSLQTYSPPARIAVAPGHASGGSFRVPFERRGTLMLVSARVNDSVSVPFLIDTGASGITLPERYAPELGIRVGSATERVTVTTANGAIRVPVVELASVQLGGARVEGLYATLNSSLDVGLLGGSFFNNYEYSVDAAAGVITLRPNEGVRGGVVAAQWQERFQALHTNIARLEAHLAKREITRANRRHELEQGLADLRQRLVELDREANRAGVPQRWRR